MKLSKTKALIGLALTFASSCFIGSIQQVNAAGYKPLQITGTRSIDVNYTANDTQGITNYSGAYKVSLCNNCHPAADFNLTENGAGKNGWSAWVDVKNDDGQVVSAVQNGSLKHFQWEIPSTIDTIHEVCVVVADGANAYSQRNTSYPICREIYYDASPAVIEDITLNGGNHWINTGEIPLTMTITDNRAGITDIYYDTGFGYKSNIPRNDIDCTLSNHPVLGDGTWTCEIDTTLITNFNKDKIDVTFYITDNVGNYKVYNEAEWTMYYDGVDPEGTVEILNDGSGHVNSNVGYIDYHIVDPVAEPWIYNSGIMKVTLATENGTEEGTNQRTLFTSDLADPQKSVDGFISDYVLGNCSEAPMSIFLVAYDKAGNISDKIRSNTITCPQIGVSDVILTDVVNPGYYTYDNPFIDKNWIWDDSAIYGSEQGYIEKEPDLTYPHALAGANISFEIHFEWEGDTVNNVYGYYTLVVKDDLNTFNKEITYSFTDSDVTKNGTDLVVNDTKMILRDAPSTDGTNHVYVYLKAVGFIETSEGGKKKITSTIFPSNEAEYGGKIAEIYGSIEDYLYFGEIN